jgi:antitoxin HicB
MKTSSSGADQEKAMEMQTTNSEVMTDINLEAQVQALLARPYHLQVTGDPSDGYLGSVAELPGCITAGDTPEEAMELLRDAMAGWFESALVHGDQIPGPTETNERTYNGRVLVRMAPSLHRQLIEQAREQGVPLNQWLTTLLASQAAMVSTLKGVSTVAPLLPLIDWASLRDALGLPVETNPPSPPANRHNDPAGVHEIAGLRITTHNLRRSQGARS